MKKLLLLLILALIAAVPYGMGWYVEGRYNTLISTLNRQYGDNVRFTGNFKRGYLSSDAKTEIILLLSKEQINIKHKIQHGPVIFNFTSWLSASSYIPAGYLAARIDTTIDSKFIKQLNGFYTDKPALTIGTDLQFNGNSTTVISNPPLNIPVFTGKLNWSGFTANILVDKALTGVNVAFMAPKLAYNENPKEITKAIDVVTIKFNFDKVFASPKMHASFTVDKATVKVNNEDVVNLNNATIDMQEETLGKLIGLQLNYHFDTLKVDADNYGPLNLTLKFSNIDIEAIEKSPPQGSQPFIINGTNMNISTEQALEFFSKLPGMDVNLNFDTPKGKINVIANTIAGGKDLVSADQQAILDTMKLNATVKMDKVLLYSLLAEQIQQQIEDSEKEFYLKHKNATKNPYTLTPEEMQKIVETLIVAFMDKLQKDNLMIEKDNTVSADIKYEKNVININGVDRSTADLDKLSSMLEYKAADTSLPDKEDDSEKTADTTKATDADKAAEPAPEKASEDASKPQ